MSWVQIPLSPKEAFYLLVFSAPNFTNAPYPPPASQMKHSGSTPVPPTGGGGDAILQHPTAVLQYAALFPGFAFVAFTPSAPSGVAGCAGGGTRLSGPGPYHNLMRKLGCGQVARRRNLDPTIKGSNPFTPDQKTV